MRNKIISVIFVLIMTTTSISTDIPISNNYTWWVYDINGRQFNSTINLIDNAPLEIKYTQINYTYIRDNLGRLIFSKIEKQGKNDYDILQQIYNYEDSTIIEYRRFEGRLPNGFVIKERQYTIPIELEYNYTRDTMEYKIIIHRENITGYRVVNRIDEGIIHKYIHYSNGSYLEDRFENGEHSIIFHDAPYMYYNAYRLIIGEYNYIINNIIYQKSALYNALNDEILEHGIITITKLINYG